MACNAGLSQKRRFAYCVPPLRDGSAAMSGPIRNINTVAHNLCIEVS